MRTVLCHGVFDLLHFGHIEHLRLAREFGDYLVVSVVADKFITKRRPIYTQEERVRMLGAIRYVDRVVLCNAPGPELLIEEIRPSVYVRGADYFGKFMPESTVLNRLQIPVRNTSSCHPRTTDIIKRVLTYDAEKESWYAQTGEP